VCGFFWVRPDSFSVSKLAWPCRTAVSASPTLMCCVLYFFFPLPVITFCVWLVFWTVTTQNSGLLLGGVGCGSLFFFGFFLWSKMIQNAGALLRVARRCFLYVNFFFCDVDCLVSGEYIAGPLLREVGG